MKKSFYNRSPKNTKVSIIAIVILFLIVVSIASRGGSSTNSATSTSQSTVQNFQDKLATTQTLEAPKDKVRNGVDKYTWPNGTNYDGEWVNNKISGKGSIEYKNGDKYIGSFKDNKKSGKGTYIWANSEIYIGNWVGDKMSGEGSYKYKNGDAYKGSWSNNKMHGNGIYTLKGGKSIKGLWSNNKFTGKTTSTQISSQNKVASGSTATFSLGSKKDDVKKIMGTPTSNNSSSWDYGLSTIYFDKNDTVIGWSNIDKNLKVSIGSKKNNAKPFSLNSSKQSVIDAMGTPTSLSSSSWDYGLSTIYFSENKTVNGWTNIDKNLKVSIGSKKANAKPFAIGSSKQDVIDAMGTPTALTSTSWDYGLSTVYFNDNGKVGKWSNIDKNLKCK